ncbi:MAG TPA: threonine/serine dehydratase, partial [Gemmatimonadales bacterium]|nr:threonine/serine dehydratase [Gemmatimonadales bacterium]
KLTLEKSYSSGASKTSTEGLETSPNPWQLRHAYMDLTREQIAVAHRLIQPHIRRTPVVEVDTSDFGLAPSVRLWLKLELMQHTGSFKPRGAFTNLPRRKVSAAGVVAASGGNHGAAVAFAAMRLEIPAKIFVPTVASESKIQLIKDCGADVVVGGDRYADALTASELWVQSTGAMPVHAYDQPETILGQGTVGAELEEQAPDLDVLLVAVGGGGLLGGISAWYAGSARKPRLIGVEPEQAPTLTMALAAGRPVDAPAGGIAADSLAPRRVGELMLPLAQRHVEQVLLVSDDAIV